MYVFMWLANVRKTIRQTQTLTREVGLAQIALKTHKGKKNYTTKEENPRPMQKLYN